MGALHHFSIPWNPDEIEQREGRIRRYGNQNKEVRIYTYLTTNIAQFRLQTLERKSQLIKQAFGKRDRETGGAIRHVENEVDMDYMELLAATTGNPDIKENAEVSKTLMKLKMLEKSYNDSKIKAISKVGFLESELEYELSSYKSKIEFMEKNPYDKTNFSMELKTENGFETFEDRSKAAIHLVHALSNGDKHEIIGKYKGRDICVSFFNGRPVLIDWNKEEGPGIFDGIKFEGWQADEGSKIIGWMDRLIGMKEALVEKQGTRIKEDEESI
ncbi:superfamily II DNA and RNA helicase, partial [mine drainage metagenome]